MIRLLVALALLLGGLVALDASLADRDRRARLERLRVAPLVPPERQAELVVAGLALRVPGMRDEIVFGRADGVWVARNYHDAFADGPRIVELVGALMGARGVVRTRSSERAPAYGFGEESVVVARLLDTKLEPVMTFELGHAPPGPVDGGFVRMDDDPAIWAIDTDPRRIVLEGVRPGRPPLLDPHVIPKAEPSPWGLPTRILFGGHPGGVRELARGPDTGDPRDPPGWTVRVGEDEPRPAGLLQAYHYANFARSLEFTRQWEADESTFGARGLTDESPRLGLAFEDAPNVELVIGARAPEAGVFVLNLTTARLYTVDEEAVPLLFPQLDDLMPSESGGTLWEDELR